VISIPLGQFRLPEGCGVLYRLDNLPVAMIEALVEVFGLLVVILRETMSQNAM
jgi:hypothetical protein